MKLNLLTYSDDLYAPMQAKLVQHAESLKIFDKIYTKHRSELIETEFYKQNKYILDKPVGGGYCAWKPFFILQAFEKMNHGDILLYLDSADWINNPFENENDCYVDLGMSIINKMKNHDMLLTAGAFAQKHFTKRDTFVYMFCDEPKYWNSIQIEAGVILLKKTEYTKKIMQEWLQYCTVSSIITDDENTCNLSNFDGFVAGRYDQSILNNIRIKYNIETSDFVRNFVTCNVNNPE